MTDRTHVLRADLSTGTVTRERVPERWRRRYLGGKGLGARYLYAELDAGVDPLGAENLLGFFVGPLSGSLPGELRYAAVTKSPLTGLFLDSYAGGAFASRLAGSLDDCLGLLVTGAAEDPVRIEIEDGNGRILAAGTWGADAAETANAHPDAAVACVGPAGEAGVRYATIASDGGEHHAGRGGAGAVMGAKGLKAVLARGPTAEPPTAELAALREAATERYAEEDVGRWQRAAETLESADFADTVGALATEGWQRGRFEGIDGIGIDAARAAASERENPDESVPGGFRVETESGETVPRGATQMTFGAGLGLDDFDAVATLGGRCDRLGLDVIEAGTAVAWVARANEAGELDVTGRLPGGTRIEDVTFGDPEAARDLVTAIAGIGWDERDVDDGVADLVCALREGVEAAADRVGYDGVPTMKSMSLPGYDPRVAVGMALAYATSDRGGCHRRARPIEAEVFAAWDDDDRVEAVIAAQDTRSVLWSLVADDFAGETLWDDYGASFMAAHVGTTGGDLPQTPAGLAECGERIWTLVRLFNAREGADRTDDRLPAVLSEPIANGPAAGSRIDPAAFEELLTAYYRARGWGPDGLPTAATVAGLGLADLVDGSTPVGTPFPTDGPS
ncbi:aldehyde ferredoxin oxidoreductase family protein [Halorubrum vacuolatum]|uniref:Aldehyde:ferredoxin oxidoreductase n=1 Tax=Halorubrum vacuolatum TaxID=63740 RepID=A0A238VV48_HALVU|nr:aldehyde ferredoxin oxidoreductase C-terminal domain-containing protein [Halorubrum vacuolatum]SNR38212.1 aldehyde:ferredoxin oxidoreductase [Halorubrum vacuolatum]